MNLYQCYKIVDVFILGYVTYANEILKQDLTNFMKVYVILDFFAINYLKSFISNSQLIKSNIHHTATIILLFLSKYAEPKDLMRTIVNQVVSIETSTFIVFASKLLYEYRFPKLITIPLKYFSILTWIYYRIIYYPYLVNGLSVLFYNLNNGNIISITLNTCLSVIEFLGFIWTLETIKIKI